MKRLLIFFFLFSSIVGFSQNVLDNTWQFSLGDNMSWKEPDFNSASWKIIKSGRIWEEQGFADYNGFAWFRKTVFIPKGFQKEATKQHGMILNLGTIDDADQIYFNGKLLGETGKLPPNYIGAYDKIREWNIDPKIILWGNENLIAVRVFDETGGGGITGQDITLKIKGQESGFSIKAQFPRENQLFVNNEKVSFSLLIGNTALETINGKIEFHLLNDFNDTISSWNEPIRIVSHKNKQLTIDKAKLAPGFYTLYADFKSQTFNLSRTFSFGVDPEKIVSPTDRAADFENFWMRAKKELAAVDPQFRLIRNDSLSTSKRDVYLMEMRSLDNVLIRGWYACPKAPGKYPAILHVQGYSSNQQMSGGYPGDDMAVLVLNVRGHGNSRDDVNPGFPGYLQYKLKDRERYIYRGAYMDCVRAVDFLCSRPEVDARFIVVEGGSQGGALSVATAALDNERLSLCIPAVPFLSDFPDYFNVAKWPGNEFVEFEKNNPDFGWKKIYENLSYFDIKNLAPWVRCPVFMSMGLVDNVCPPHINFAAYNQLSAPKSYEVFPFSGHGLPSEYKAIKYNWMKKELEKLKNKNQ